MCKPYNGYTNYETWNVSLWIDNDEGEQEIWAEMAQKIYDHEGDEGSAAQRLSNVLKDHFNDNRPEVHGTYQDMLQAALDSVNWYEIAENMIGEVDKKEDEEETTDEA